MTKCAEIDLQKLDAKLRMQHIIFEAAAEVFQLFSPDKKIEKKPATTWRNQGTRYALFGQVVQLVEKYLNSGAILIEPPLFNTDPVHRRIIYMMNMNKIVQHLWGFIKLEQTERIVPILDSSKKVRSTSDMPTRSFQSKTLSAQNADIPIPFVDP